jgi:TPR repeat protein
LEFWTPIDEKTIEVSSLTIRAAIQRWFIRSIIGSTHIKSGKKMMKKDDNNKQTASKSQVSKSKNIDTLVHPKFHDVIGKLSADSKEALTIYEDGLTGREDKDMDSFEWTRDAAIYGIQDAVQKVVESYQKGLGTEPNARMAFEWLKKAADEKKTWAYYDLAKAYSDGLGTRVDIELFREWMTKASEFESGRDGMMELAKSYSQIRFGTPDPKKAFEWIRKMAAAGGAGAMIELSRAHATGARVALDLDEQLNWATNAVKAAEQDAVDGDYASQDLPFALVALEVALKSQKKPDEAAEKLKAASQAAYDASIFIGKNTGDIALSNDLLEIMLRNQKAREKLVDSSENFESLSRIREVAVNVYKSKDDCPAEISNAIFELAEVYQKGLGTEKSLDESTKCMELARALRDKRALYNFALESKNREDLQVAAAAGSIEAYAQAEFETCEICEGGVKSLVDLIITLRDKVYNHRREHHELAQDVEIAHYTDASALESMLGDVSGQPKNFMRMYNIAYLNDPEEGTRLYCGDREKNPLKRLWGETNISDASGKDHVYIGSFSTVYDQLNLWRAYTEHGDGFSIVTPSSAFARNFFVPQMAAAWSSELKPTQRFTLYKVLYKNEEAMEAINCLRATLEVLEEEVKTLAPEQKAVVLRVAGMVVSELVYLYKSEEYDSEKEVRFVTALRLDSEYVRRDKASPSAKLFAETRPFLFTSPGSKIVIGPTVPERESVAIALRQSLYDRGWDGTCEVKCSTVKYRKSSSHSR